MIIFGRIAAEALSPLTIVSACLLLGLAVYRCKRKKSGMILIAFGVSLLILFGYAPGAITYIENREQRYPAVPEEIPYELHSIKHIVVLGSGHTSDLRLPATTQIGGSSLYRLIEGIRLHRHLPGSTLVITGGIVIDPIPNARVVSRVAMQLGVDSENLLVLDTPKDTFEEAAVVLQHLPPEPFLLVTSALHMPRAMDVFQARGLEPIAAPTDFTAKKISGVTVVSWFPSTGNLDLCKRIFYEWAGTAWSNIRSL